MWMSSSSAANGKAPLAQLALDRVEAGEQRVAVVRGDDRRARRASARARATARCPAATAAGRSRSRRSGAGSRGAGARGSGTRRGQSTSGATAERPRRSASRHAGDLALAHLREERQRQRACGDVLAHRELALAMAEALAVEAHQVDRRQVGLALDAARRERAHGLVAIDAARELHDEHEPAAPRRRRVRRAGQLQTLDPGERLAVAEPRPARAPRASRPGAPAARCRARRRCPRGGS